MNDAGAGDITDASGYTVRYGKDKGQFRVSFHCRHLPFDFVGSPLVISIQKANEFSSSCFDAPVPGDRWPGSFLA